MLPSPKPSTYIIYSNSFSVHFQDHKLAETHLNFTHNCPNFDHIGQALNGTRVKYQHIGVFRYKELISHSP